MDYHTRGTLDQDQPGYQKEPATNQNQHWFGTCYQCSINWATEGVQGHFFLNLQRFEGYIAWKYLHQIELDTSKPHVHQVRYKLNFNYVTIIKQDINKLLIEGFIKHVQKGIGYHL